MADRHTDAEIARPSELPTGRLVEIVQECLLQWDAHPGLAGSRRWARNGTMALFELQKRASVAAERDALREALEEIGRRTVGDDIKRIARRALTVGHDAPSSCSTPLSTAADDVERLAAERDALREALMEIHAFAEERAVCHGYVARVATMAWDAITDGPQEGGMRS